MEATAGKFRLAIFLLLSASAASCDGSGHGVHEKGLELQFSDRHVIPSFARTRAGAPFTGTAYGTFFGEGSLDCVEWEGTFEDGRPHGGFKLYSSCDVLQSIVSFNHGAKVKGT